MFIVIKNVSYRLIVRRCSCASHVLVVGFPVRDCGRCGEVPFA
jgi:hypothetical protein